MSALTITGGQLVTADGIQLGGVRAEGGVITQVGDVAAQDTDTIVDAKGQLIAPGLVDLGVFAIDKPAFHFGGITRAALMPDQSPPLDLPSRVNYIAKSGKPDLWVHPLTAATRGLEGSELAELAAARGEQANACLRVNPDVDAKTHEKISTGKAENKFGVPLMRAREVFAELAALPGLDLRGVAIHIGSQLLDLEPLETAFAKVSALITDLRSAGHSVTHVDLGGGLGVPYKTGEVPPSPAEYGAMVAAATKDWDVRLAFEPGRVIAGNAGVLLTRVVRVKRGGNGPPFVIVDAAMNDLARPALYGAWHDFEAVEPSGERMTVNIVGPICETGDTFATNRECDALSSGELAIFRTAGAYGATMASSYNSRGFVAEVMVDGDQYAVVADRIDAAAILDAERVPDFLT
jgi:diaminopimelate decarboxylase